MSETNSIPGEVRLVFACSGAVDVGEIADRAARMLNREGAARMYCLGGIGAHLDESLADARKAGRILAIDGCPQDCARKCLEQAGLANIRHMRITDHQMEKGKTPVSVHNVSLAADRARHALLAL
ncbi:MAG: zinc-binding protein [Planctomycetes bacterium]|nr:zinc-binding protein [Planctomycetota bacterium]